MNFGPAETRAFAFSGVMSAPIRVSVTELVARAGSGGLGLSAPGMAERLALGSLLHRLHQERTCAADPSYRSELPLSGLLEHAGREVELCGRADGVRSEPDGTRVVEELKSAAGTLPSAGERLALERLQVELYAWLLAREGGPPVRAELIWLATDGEDGVAVAAREAVPLDLADIETRARALLGGLVAEVRAREARAAFRRGQADALAFPFAGERPGQQAIGDAVTRALAERRHLLLEAPTGIGKTIAVLLPALRHVFREGGRVLLLTSRGSQQRGALAALEHDRAGRERSRRAAAAEARALRERHAALRRGRLPLRPRLRTQGRGGRSAGEAPRRRRRAPAGDRDGRRRARPRPAPTR